VNKITFQKDGHLYFNEHKVEVPSVSFILENFGISDFSMVDGRVLEAACDFGSNVHDTTYLHDIGDLESCDPLVGEYLTHWIRFLHDYSSRNFQLMEEPLYSKIWGFAGTPDRVSDGRLIDIKTGVATVSHKIQSAFYKILIEENTEIKIKKRMTVYLRTNHYLVAEHKDKTDLSIAKSLISIYNFKKRENLL